MNWISGPYEKNDARLEKALIVIIFLAVGFMIGLIIRYQFSEPIFYERPEGILSRM